MLLESLIAMVVVLLLGMGPVFLNSKMLVNQRQNNFQMVAVSMMRSIIQTENPATLCNGVLRSITVINTTLPVTIACTAKAGTVSVSGVPVALTGSVGQNISLSVRSTELFGTPGVITLTQ